MFSVPVLILEMIGDWEFKRLTFEFKCEVQDFCRGNITRLTAKKRGRIIVEFRLGGRWMLFVILLNR